MASALAVMVVGRIGLFSSPMRSEPEMFLPRVLGREPQQLDAAAGLQAQRQAGLYFATTSALLSPVFGSTKT